MSLLENLGDVFELIKRHDANIALQAFDILCMFPHDLIIDFMQQNDFENAKTLVDIFSTFQMVNKGLLKALVIFASDPLCAELLAKNEKAMRRLYSLAKNGDPVDFVLPLTQVSRMSHETTHKTLFKIQPNYLSLLTDTFNACAGGAQQPDRLINIAYVFLNVTQTKEAVMQLFGSSKEMTMLSSFISNPTAITSFKCVIAKTLVNVSIFQGMHLFMLKDEFLADIVHPFADEDDELSTEEMEKLPLQLQYVDHKRSQCTTLLTALINLLSQLTITTSLRKKMRDLGIYAILREYDKSRRDKSLPLVEDKFMTLEGTAEWKVLMHTLIFDDEELQAGDLSSRMPDGITDFDMDELAAEIHLIENGDT